MHPREEEERRCPLCNGLMEEGEEGSFECTRCHSLARFRGEELLAMRIPHYHAHVLELERMHADVLNRIEAESGKGKDRDMRALRLLHEERQRILAEYSFMGYFRQFLERW